MPVFWFVWPWWAINPIGGAMTTPTPTTATKAVVAGVGGLLITVIPILQAVGDFLPQPWPAIITGLIALLTVVGVYQTPNKARTP